MFFPSRWGLCDSRKRFASLKIPGTLNSLRHSLPSFRLFRSRVWAPGPTGALSPNFGRNFATTLRTEAVSREGRGHGAQSVFAPARGGQPRRAPWLPLWGMWNPGLQPAGGRKKTAEAPPHASPAPTFRSARFRSPALSAPPEQRRLTVPRPSKPKSYHPPPRTTGHGHRIQHIASSQRGQAITRRESSGHQLNSPRQRGRTRSGVYTG